MPSFPGTLARAILPPMRPTDDASTVNAGRLSRQLARVASVLWLVPAVLWTAFAVQYVYGALTGEIHPAVGTAVAQVLVFASVAAPSWFLVWALWTRPRWPVAIFSAVGGVLLFVLLAGTLLGIVVLAAGLLPLIGMATRPQP
jgi:hypothetical protein